jgi:hypothetical protein
VRVALRAGGGLGHSGHGRQRRARPRGYQTGPGIRRRPTGAPGPRGERPGGCRPPGESGPSGTGCMPGGEPAAQHRQVEVGELGEVGQQAGQVAPVGPDGVGRPAPLKLQVLQELLQGCRDNGRELRRRGHRPTVSGLALLVKHHARVSVSRVPAAALPARARVPSPTARPRRRGAGTHPRHGERDRVVSRLVEPRPETVVLTRCVRREPAHGDVGVGPDTEVHAVDVPVLLAVETRRRAMTERWVAPASSARPQPRTSPLLSAAGGRVPSRAAGTSRRCAPPGRRARAVRAAPGGRRIPRRLGRPAGPGRTTTSAGLRDGERAVESGGERDIVEVVEHLADTARFTGSARTAAGARGR